MTRTDAPEAPAALFDVAAALAAPNWRPARGRQLAEPGTPPRYIGSLTEYHGEVVSVRPCPLVCCSGVDEWDQPHASLTVVPDAGPEAGRLVKMDRARFESFTGRP